MVYITFQETFDIDLEYLKASPLTPAPWQLQASWLLACCLDNILIGLVACWLVGFLLCGSCFAFFLLQCVFARWFLDVTFHIVFSAAASPQPLTIAHCFKTLGSDRFDGLPD